MPSDFELHDRVTGLEREVRSQSAQLRRLPTRPAFGGGGGGGTTVTFQYGRVALAANGALKAPVEPADITDTDGTLSTYVDDETGTLTLDASHGFATDEFFDLFWDGGARYRVKAGTVSGTSVPIVLDDDPDHPVLAFGDVLPVATTPVLARPRPESADWPEVESPVQIGRGEFIVYENARIDTAALAFNVNLPPVREESYNVSEVAGVLASGEGGTSGTLTMDSSAHGCATGNTLDVIWAGGLRYKAVAGTVSGASIPFSGGTGDVLPANSTAVTIKVRVESNYEKAIWEVPLPGCLIPNQAVIAINGVVMSASPHSYRPTPWPPEPPPP